MDLRKFAAKRVVVWVILGLLGGGVAADVWWRQRGAQQQAALKARNGEELRQAEAQIKQLTEQLEAERQRREALERQLSEGRK